MSMIAEQIKQIREYASKRKGEISDICNKAADTIEILSERLKELKAYKEQGGEAVSRQAVFDALEKVAGLFPWRVPGKLDTYDSYNGAWNDAIGRAEMEIEGLPPVNPQPEIIRCGQCKYAEVADKEDTQDGYTCQFHRGSIWFSGSYCSWAERSGKE